MTLALAPQNHICPLETLLSIYTPILECLVSHLPTSSKLALSQSSRSLRQLLYRYPRFFAHLDFRLSVFESANFDSYPLGTVYNLDRLLQCLPVDGRIVSLTLDWTAVSGSFLFNKILDRCSQTLEHLSVRGCRKVSIKHHIVPHFVYQSSIFPLGDHCGETQTPALKSLYVYKARGVRRKPFLIDRKPADGDEPSRYLTTLAAGLGIWVDLGLCPTPKLRCPRRREILRRGKENFCVPFDKRWRVQDDNESLSEAEHVRRRLREQGYGEDLVCWNCDAEIPDRCEACVHQMTCSSCEKPLCHNCAYISRAALGQAVNQAVQSVSVAATANHAATWVAMGLVGANPQPLNNSDQDDPFEAEPCAIRSKLLTPCCRIALGTHADNLCSLCYAQMKRAACSLCDKPLCIKHELERCRRCEGGCNRVFCFSTSDNRDSGCGEPENGRAQMKDCLGCGMEVCGSCRTSFANNNASAQQSSSAPSPAPSSAEEDDDGSESTISAGDGGGGGGGGRSAPASGAQKSCCSCKVCIDNYYCPGCWPTKPLPCEPRPASILQQRKVMRGSVELYQIAFEDPSEPARWFTLAAISEQHPQIYPAMLEEFTARQQLSNSHISYPFATATPDQPGFDEIPDSNIKVGMSDWILERVLAVRPGSEGADSWHPPLPSEDGADDDVTVLCKWLGRTMAQATWEKNERFGEETHPRERKMVDQFVLMCLHEDQRSREVATNAATSTAAAAAASSPVTAEAAEDAQEEEEEEEEEEDAQAGAEPEPVGGSVLI